MRIVSLILSHNDHGDRTHHHLVFITVTLYCAFLEAGLGLIAACLPSLSGIHDQWSLSLVIDIIRRTISLPPKMSHTGIQAVWKVSDSEPDAETLLMSDIEGVRTDITVNDAVPFRDGLC